MKKTISILGAGVFVLGMAAPTFAVAQYTKGEGVFLCVSGMPPPPKAVVVDDPGSDNIYVEMQESFELTNLGKIFNRGSRYWVPSGVVVRKVNHCS